MSFAVNTPGGQVRLMDLPLEVFEGLEAETQRRYAQLVGSPAWTAKSANAVYRAACVHIGCEPEQLTPGKLVGQAEDGSDAIFVEVSDDLPTVYEDGLPKAEAATSTSGSSGAPDGSDGPQQ